MTKGGYQIINFNDVDLSTPKTIKGIYSKIANTRKALLFSGVKVNGMLCRDTFVTVENAGTSYVGALYAEDGTMITLSINNNDLVEYIV